jgi:uncharacterized protein YndB with AHSA1/START domain
MSVSRWFRFRSKARLQSPVGLFVAALLGSSPLDFPGERTLTQESPVRVTRTSDREIEVTGTFTVPRQVLFDAITQPEHLTHWMSAGGMTLAGAHVDPRAGGSFRYEFKRPSGATIQVRGAYRSFDPPRGFAYLETYDFSPLQIEVTTALEEAGRETRFMQTLRYASTHERDEDFDGVATSSREAYAKLARYLETRKPAR